LRFRKPHFVHVPTDGWHVFIILEVPGSHIGTGTDCPRGFSAFTQMPVIASIRVQPHTHFLFSSLFTVVQPLDAPSLS